MINLYTEILTIYVTVAGIDAQDYYCVILCDCFETCLANVDICTNVDKQTNGPF